MDERTLRDLLTAVASGEITLEDAVGELRDLPYRDLGDTLLDRHRAIRVGMPEVIFAESKTAEQVARIASELATESVVLITRLDEIKYKEAAQLGLPEGTYDPHSRTHRVLRGEIEITGKGTVLVVSAGTSDLPVAEEAAITAETLGNRVERVHDAGVAGLHRILDHREALNDAAVVVVVAGMDAALPSVVAGLTAAPIVAVPTSVGYGSALGGLSPLFSMLNACSGGVTVVNIDNGFGAGVAASRINRK